MVPLSILWKELGIVIDDEDATYAPAAMKDAEPMPLATPDETGTSEGGEDAMT